MNPNKETTIEVKVALRASDLVITASVDGAQVVITNETPEPLKVLSALIEDAAFRHAERVYRSRHIEAFRKLLNKGRGASKRHFYTLRKP